MDGLLQFNSEQEVEIRPELLSIPEFKTIWGRDKTKKKEKARKELTYIYFFADFRSNLVIFDEKQRREEAIRTIFGGDSDWQPDEKTQAAVDKYRELQETPSMKLLESALRATGKIQDYFDSIDFKERDDKGHPVYKITDVTRSLKEVEDITKSLKKLREQLRQEQEQGDERVRGGGSKSLFEDPGE